MKNIIIVDFDNVLYKGQSQQHLVLYLLRSLKIDLIKFSLAIFWFLTYKVGFNVNPKLIRENCYSTFKGWTKNDFDCFIKHFTLDFFPKYSIVKMVEVVKNHLKNGDEVLILSSTLKSIVDLFVCVHHLDGCQVIATKINFINNISDGTLVGLVPFGVDKVRYADNYILSRKLSWSNSTVYADSYSDIYLLKRASNPIVVNPDSKLRNFSQKKLWKSYDF